MGSGARLRITGSMPEKFIQKLLAAGVRIRECRRLTQSCTEMRVPRRDAPKVIALAEKYCLPCDDLGCEGTSALAVMLLRRRTALLGVVAMVLTAALLLSRVWMVQVLPVEDVDEALLVRAGEILAENGASPGASAWLLDRSQLRSALIGGLPEAGYVSVKRKGVCLVAEISQAVQPPQTYDIGAARDIVAMYDGVILRVDVYAGTAAVEPGMTVRRGEVLIRGEERTSGELPRAVSAEGVVMARIWQTDEARASLTRTENLPTGRVRTGEEIALAEWSLPLTAVEPFENEAVRTEFLPIGGVFFPLGVRRTVHMEQEVCVQNVDERQLKAEMEAKSDAILDENMPFAAKVIDKWSEYSMIDLGQIYMKRFRELEADIAASGRAEQ